MFNSTIEQLESQISYHQEQCNLAQSELDGIQAAQAFADNAVEHVKETIDNLEPKYLDVFKEHLLNLFSNNSKNGQPFLESTPRRPAVVEQQEVQEEAPQEIIEEVEVSPVEIKTEEEDTPRTRAKLLGIPDFTPDTYEDLAPNVTYSSSNRAYVGFNDKDEAEKFRDNLSEPSLLDDAVIMNGFKYEVKFHCSKEYAQEVVNSINSVSEDVQTPNIEKIDGSLVYNHVDSICYVAGRSKGRLDNYGSYLTRILDIGESYTVSKEPTFFETKYELRIEGVEFDSALHLQSFNLIKEYNAKENNEARQLWRTTRQRVHPPAYTPLPKAIALEDVELGAIVTSDPSKVKEKQYKVIQKVKMGGISHVEAICIYHREMPTLVGNTDYLKDIYPVPADDIQVDSQFEEHEEVKTKAVPKPVLKEVKKSSKFTTEDFPPGPYQKISLDEIEVCDIVSTGEFVKGYYEIYQHCGDHVLGRCLYHDSLPLRIGQDGYYIKSAYLVEKCSQGIITAA